MRIEDLLSNYARTGRSIDGITTIPRRFWYGGPNRLLILIPLRDYEVRANRYFWYRTNLDYILENLDPLTFCLTPRYPPADYSYHGSVIFGETEFSPKGPRIVLPDYDDCGDDPYYQFGFAITKINVFLSSLGTKLFQSGHQKKVSRKA